ncbi:tyrosine-type recombinase/integrase [Halomonas sp. MG34]|nr:tyrosine-type recombinase/integrase [Halomonas sp. MG34]
MQLDELFRAFLAIKSAEGRASATMQQYRNNYAYFIDFLTVRNVKPEYNEMNRHLFRDYILYMREEVTKFDGHQFKTDKQRSIGLAPSTINTRLKTLRVMFRCLHDEQIIPENPIVGVKPVPNPLENIEVLTAEELKKLLKMPDKATFPGFRDHALMHVLIDGMMRIGEATQLKESDFDMTQNTVNIRAAIAKSRKPRTLPLKPLTTRLVGRLIEANAEFNTEYVFNTNYGEPMGRDRFRQQLYTYAEQANIKKKVHPHLLRHTAATLFLESGGDIRHLQMLLGHADLRMVVRYTHLSDHALKEQHTKYSPINKVADKLSRPRKTKL